MILRVLAAVAMLTAVLGLAACSGGSTAARVESTPSVAPQTRTSPATLEDQPVAPAPADRKVNELTGFVAPSGNVACMIDAEWARCDIIDHDWEPPPRPMDCEFDYGGGISLAPGEQPEFVCAGDTVFGADEVLPYGESITAGVLRCESAESGITCRDDKAGHGFSISRQAYQLF
jgi:Family of unknown function (DUF6636)